MLLREMTLSDMGSLSLILQDEKVMYAYNWAFSDKETFAWMQKQLQRYKDYGFGLWGVILKDTNEMIIFPSKICAAAVSGRTVYLNFGNGLYHFEV